MDFEKDIIGKDFAPDGMDEDSGLDEDDMNTDVGDQEGVEIDVTSDGGVKKKIITKGSGWEKPEFGDDVEVHYVGTLEDGTKFDSSRDRGEPFRFKVGTGVISGWSEGVKTMKKGEKSVFTMTSNYGYGTMGSPPKIPADATLIFEIELLSWKSVKDISHDGGVIKTIQAEGQGWETPQERDEVLVRYSAKVQGQEAPFAESGDAGTEFTVQDGFLCRAVKVAVKTMKKGEKAQLLVAPEYGFGADGRDGVGADAMLEMDLELVSWKKVQELEGSAVWMKTLVPGGEGDYNRPNDGAKCSIRLTGKLQDGTVFEERKEGSELEVVIDNEQLPEGVEKALLKMKKGEIAEVHIEDASFGFGNAASQQQLAEVPAGSRLLYTVELVSFEKAKESWDMDEDEKIAKAKELKEEGNQAYKKAKLARAIRKYDKALKMIQHDDSFDHENKVQTKELKKSFWLNLAAANLRLKDYKQTAQHCTSVLDKDPSCTKALYRRAQAFMGTQDLVEAEVDMKAALSNEPENKELQGLMRQLKQLKRVQNKKEAAMFGRMFAKPLFADVPVTMSTDDPAPDAEAADAVGEESEPTMVTEAAEEVAAS